MSYTSCMGYMGYMSYMGCMVTWGDNEAAGGNLCNRCNFVTL